MVGVAATNTEGTGPESMYTFIPPFPSTSSFASIQFVDFAGRSPTSSELTSWTTALTAGTTSPASRVVAVAQGSYWKPRVEPVTRLFYAYFQRPPDTGGLGYWSGKVRAGTKLDAVSSAFAASSEFKTTYGSLTNQGFVNLVYQNVLGRPGDSSGIAYWTGQLDQGSKSRGQVMTGFSESNEFKTKKAGEVAVISITFGCSSAPQPLQNSTPLPHRQDRPYLRGCHDPRHLRVRRQGA